MAALSLLSISFLLLNVNGEIEYYPSMGEMTKYNTKFHKQNKDLIEFVKLEKRAVDPVFHGHPKTREELWREKFLAEDKNFHQTQSLVRLVHNLTQTYLTDCTSVVLYDNQIYYETKLFQDLFKTFPVTYIHGYLDGKNRYEANIIQSKERCLHYILFLTDVQRSHKVLGKQSRSKIVVIAKSSQWAVSEYLSNPSSRLFINLLIVSPSFKGDDETLEASYILHTHSLYTDGLGSSKSQILTSWIRSKFSRNVNLFPPKMMKGYAGHRFLIAVAHQPPYTIKSSRIDVVSGGLKTIWDGVEIRMMRLLAERNNFSIEFIEPRELHLGPGDSVANEVASGRADMGIAGLYTTAERFRDLDLSFGHSQDCAAFITLASTALPRYRAILGPFHWHVWVALTFTYLIAIFPLAFSDKHTLSHLINNSGEIENMFWYVFGTFTNCFTFVGKHSWSKTDKVTTRLLIGWYWLFTIIITSCYTGSIIAFVTLPIYPETIDTVPQLLSGFFAVGTLDRGGWERWFLNSSDHVTRKLLKKLEFVPNVESGIRNVTRAFFWPYAFIGSKAELEYLIQANFSKSESKRAVLHISNECFVPFTVAFSFPNNSAHTIKLSKDLSTMFQTGIVDKITQEVMWEIQKKGGGKLLTTISTTLSSNSIEEKGLTMEDTQGMFLLLGAGFLIAAIALLSEWMGGFTRRCRQLKRRMSNTSATDENESRLYFNTRSSSAESKETVDGQTIYVTQEDIDIHNTYDVFDSRRSSSLELDREVENVFRRDGMRKIHSKCIKENLCGTAKVFGDKVSD